MRHIIPEVLNMLQSSVASFSPDGLTQPVHEHAPLDIVEKLAPKDMASYKEPWKKSRCLASIKTTTLYEASCNVTWFNPGVVPDGIPRDVPSWTSTYELMTIFFSHSQAVGAHTTGEGSQIKRRIFPVTLLVYVETSEALNHDTFNSTLPLAAGHGMLYAWYLGMYLALTSGDHVLVQELWQCGLTTTARVRCCSDLATIVLDTIAFSETLQANEKSLRDTCLAFSEKVALLYPDTTKQAVAVDTLLEQGVRYNGTKMNRTMYFACMLVAKEYTGTVRDRLVLLERKHGRDLLSLSYNKMMRIAQIVQKLAGAAPTSDGLCFVLEMMHISIARKMTRNGSKFFTLDTMDKQKDGSAGWIGSTCAKWKTIRYLLNSSSTIAETNKLLADELEAHVFPKFTSPMMFQTGFSQADDPPEVGLTTSAEEGPPESEDLETSLDTLAEALAARSPAAQLMLQLLYDIYTGVFDSSFKALGNEIVNMKAVLESRSAGTELMANRITAFLNAAATLSVTSTSEKETAPPPSARVLARTTSDPTGEDRDRFMREHNEIWKQAQAERKKYVQILTSAKGAGAHLTSQHLMESFKKSAVRDFPGKAKVSHRAVLFAADLMWESDVEPWFKFADPVESDMRTVVDFMLTFNSGYDFLFLFDGRHRDARKMIESMTAGRAHCVECWITYTNTRASVASGRKVALSATNREVFFVFTPWARTNLASKARESFCACGETSTHNSTYSGVPCRGLTQLPRMHRDEKMQIFPKQMAGAMPKQVVKRLGHDVPLYWQEYKPAAFFRQLFDDFDIGAVFDLTPGSGACAEAAMSAGIKYSCTAMHKLHAAWLANVMDQTVLTQIVKQGAPLYQPDLAKHIMLHFQDVVEAAQAQADGQETISSSDDEVMG